MHIALDDGGTGNQHIPLRSSVILQHGVERDNQHTVARNDDKRAETKGQHPQHDFSRVTAEADADVYPVAEQKPQDKQAGARL